MAVRRSGSLFIGRCAVVLMSTLLVLAPGQGAVANAPMDFGSRSDPSPTAQAVRAPGAADPSSTYDNSTADLSNRVPARVVLQFDDGTVRRGDGWCGWSEDRRSVEEVEALDIRVRGRLWNVTLWSDDLLGPALSLWSGGRSGYESGRGGTVDVVTPLGRTGEATFADIPGRGKAEGTISGRVAWRCDAPPPRKRGHTDASVTLATTGPLAVIATTTGYCTWVDRGDVREVGSVDAFGARIPVGDGRYVGVFVDVSRGARGPSADPYVPVSDASGDVSDGWTAEASHWVLSVEPDLSVGVVRALGLRPEDMDEEQPPSFLDPSTVSATIAWDCGDPPPRAAGRDDAREAIPFVPGRLSLDIAAGAGRTVSVPADCAAARTDYYVSVDDVGAEVEIDGHVARFVMIDWLDRYLLLLHDAEGNPLGEYIAESDRSVRREDDEGWSQAGPLLFQPAPGTTPPALFGATTPEAFTATVTIDCPVPVYWEAMGGYDHLGAGETLAEVVDAADLVVVGEPFEIESLQRRPGDATAAKDLVTLRVDDVLKGRSRASGKDSIALVVRRLPGVGDDLIEAILPRDRVLLFLRAVDRGHRYELINPGQGVVRDFDEVIGVMPDVGPDTFPGDWRDESFESLIAAISKHVR